MNQPSHPTTNAGLRITTDRIEFAITSKTGIKQFTALPLEPKTIQSGELANPDKLKICLIQILKQTHLENKFITLGLPEHTNFLKSLTIDGLPNAEILPKIMWESENQLPLPSNELYIDWAWIPNSHQQIQVVAMPQKTIDTYIEILHQPEIGLIPMAVEPNSLTLLRLIPQPDEPLLLIDADNTATLILVEPGSALNLSAIRQSSNPQELNPELNQVIIEMLDYYQKSSDKKVTQIIYTGPLSGQLPNLLPKNIPNQQIKLPPGVQPLHAAAYSLAQKPISPPQDTYSLNLIPPTIQDNYRHAATHQLKRIILIVSIFSLIITNLFALWFLIQILLKQNTIGLSQTSTLDKNDLTTQINQINQQSAALTEIINQEQQFNHIFQQVINLLPDDVTIKYIQIDPSKHQITIRGVAPIQEQILEFKQQLENASGFTNVTLPFSVLEKQINVEFSLTFNWQTETQTPNITL